MNGDCVCALVMCVIVFNYNLNKITNKQKVQNTMANFAF